MPDLLTQLAQIRNRQGLEPIDSTRIEGFESGSPPPPPFMPSSVTQRDHFVDEDPDAEEPVTYQSPLVAAAQPAEAPRTAPTPGTDLPAFELIVCDTSAAYRGHAVELTRQEKNAVASVVLEALGRALDALRSEVDGRQAAGVTAAEKAALRAPLEPLRRKRGRPRKVKP